MNSAPVPRLACTSMEAPEALGVSDDYFREHIAHEVKWVRRGNPTLLAFARLVDDLCEAALEQTGRDLPVEHAVVMLLRDAAEAEPREIEERRLAA